MKYFRVKFDCKELYTKDSPTFCFSKYLSVLQILSEKILKMFPFIWAKHAVKKIIMKRNTTKKNDRNQERYSNWCSSFYNVILIFLNK